jgi:hypothetical protein
MSRESPPSAICSPSPDQGVLARADLCLRSGSGARPDGTIDNDDLDGAAHWITKKVIAGGEDGLTPEQKLVFKRDVLGNFVTGKCRNGHDVPWPEKYKALHNGGFCFHCYDRMTRYRDE